MVNEYTKRRNLIVDLIVIAVIVGAVCVYFFAKKDSEVSFEANDKLFFKMFANLYEQDEYEFYSLDSYYLEDTQMYYYNAKYKGYSTIDDTWYDTDQVSYGRIENFYNMYCLSWDELYGFEEEDKEFKRAQKEGIHKTYTEKELDKLLDKAYKAKEAELSKN